MEPPNLSSCRTNRIQDWRINMSSLWCKVGEKWPAMRKIRSGTSEGAGVVQEPWSGRHKRCCIYISLYIYMLLSYTHTHINIKTCIYLLYCKYFHLGRNILLVTHTLDVVHMTKISRLDPQRQDDVSAGTERVLEKGEETWTPFKQVKNTTFNPLPSG